MIQFATTYAQPARFSPLPFEVFVYIDVDKTGSVFFERRYLNQAGELLEIIATPVPEDKRGLVRLLAQDLHLKAAASMELALVDEDTTTPAGVGPRVTFQMRPFHNGSFDHTFDETFGEDPLPTFATPYHDAVAFTNLPFEVSILVSGEMANREMYFQRRYLDPAGRELEVRSTAIPPTAAGHKVRLKLDTDPLHCAARVELSIVDTFKATVGSCDGVPVDYKIFDFTFDFTFE